MKSSLQSKLHVGIIMDGNGRWAAARALPRLAGHEAGIEAVRRVVGAAPAAGIGTLTLFAFSCDNWRRPQAEVAALMGLMRTFLQREAGRLAQEGTRLTMIGRRDRLAGDLAGDITRAERASAHGRRLHLRLAVDYSARDAIVRAAAEAEGEDDLTVEAIGRRLAGTAEPCDVDLLIRTSGEQRLSDFLLWECAYAELYFTLRLWPDFGPDDLAAALAWFHGRQRRFGALPTPASAA
jgi:undecaprenyl diphosphate synthase